MTTAQLNLLHIAKRQLRLDDPSYRLILKNVGGVHSGKQLSHSAFEKVMAFFEERGFRCTGRPDDWFRSKVDRQDHREISSRSIAKIHALHAELPNYQLPGLCRRFSHDRTDQVEQLDQREAYELIEMLKAAGRRRERPPTPRAEDPLLAAVTDDELPF